MIGPGESQWMMKRVIVRGTQLLNGRTWKARIIRIAGLLVFTAALSAVAVEAADIYSAHNAAGVANGLRLIGLTPMTETQLIETVRSNHLVVYWAGPQNEVEYLLNASNPSAIVLTFLPKDRGQKETRASYPQITTYIVDNAFQAVLSGGGNPGVQGVEMPSGNSVFYSNLDPNDAYVGIPGRNIELQIFDPSQRLWLALLAEPGKLGQIM